MRPGAAQAYAEEGLPFPDDWLVEFEGPVYYSACFSTEQDALAGLEHVLFSRGNEFLVEHHMKKAIEAQDFELLIRLAEGRGRAEGYREAAAEMKGFLSSLQRR